MYEESTPVEQCGTLSTFRDKLIINDCEILNIIVDALLKKGFDVTTRRLPCNKYPQINNIEIEIFKNERHMEKTNIKAY